MMLPILCLKIIFLLSPPLIAYIYLPNTKFRSSIKLLILYGIYLYYKERTKKKNFNYIFPKVEKSNISTCAILSQLYDLHFLLKYNES